MTESLDFEKLIKDVRKLLKDNGYKASVTRNIPEVMIKVKDRCQKSDIVQLINDNIKEHRFIYIG